MDLNRCHDITLLDRKDYVQTARDPTERGITRNPGELARFHEPVHKWVEMRRCFVGDEKLGRVRILASVCH